MTLEILTILIFLCFSLVVGAYASRGIRTIKDYATGGHAYSTPILLSTLLATYVGANSLVGGGANGFNYGLNAAFSIIGIPITSLLIAFFLAGKAQRFHNKLSLANAIGEYYGPVGQIAGGLLSFLMVSFVLAAQMLGIGTLLDSLLGVPLVYSIVIGGGVVVRYSTLGGIRRQNESLSVCSLFFGKTNK